MHMTISTEPLTQMFRSITSQRRTGLLRVERIGEKGREQGEIYFEGGRPRGAKTSQDTGKAALQRILSWKHITCLFDWIDKPYLGNLLALAAPKEQSAEQELLARHLPTPALAETDPLPGVLSSVSRNQPGGDSGFQHGQFVHIPSKMPPGAHAKTSPSRPFTTQPLVRRAETLEESKPAQSPKASQPKQRWSTTRLVPQTPLEPLLPEPLPPEPLPQARPLSPLPGWRAVFKPRIVPTSAQSLQQMERRERIVFILLNGSRTIRDIARLTQSSETEVEIILVRLTMHGYTERVLEPQPPPSLQEKLVDLFSSPAEATEK